MVHCYKSVANYLGKCRYMMIYTGVSQVGYCLEIAALDLLSEYLLDRIVTNCIFCSKL